MRAVEMKRSGRANRPFYVGQMSEALKPEPDEPFKDTSICGTRQDIEPVREMYRVFAPYHCLVESGTVEFGLFSDIDLARGRLAEVAKAISENAKATEIQWRTQDAFVTIDESYGTTTTRRYYIQKFFTNTPFLIQISGYKGDFPGGL